MSERLTDDMVAYLSALDAPMQAGTGSAVLAREVLASRKLIADLRALHQPMWFSEQAKAAGKEPWVCELCGTGDGSWPCESVLLIDEAGL